MRTLSNLFVGRRIRGLRSKGFDKQECVLFLTHKWSRAIAGRHAKLVSDLRGLADVFILYDSASRGFPRDIENAFPFSARKLERNLGYSCFTQGKIVPGSVHLPLIWFALRHRCRHYWAVEYDVNFSGDWRELIGAFAESSADLVGAHIRHYPDTADWIHWPAFRQPAGSAVPEDKLTKSFMPILRLSRPGVVAVDNFHKAGFRGHAEMIIPTCLAVNGMKIQDFNDERTFYRGEQQDPVFDLEQLSTLRWRPPVEMDSEFYRGENLIYHPVK